eukprot:763575-Hanusia_phi.AAC.2
MLMTPSSAVGETCFALSYVKYLFLNMLMCILSESFRSLIGFVTNKPDLLRSADLDEPVKHSIIT